MDHYVILGMISIFGGLIFFYLISFLGTEKDEKKKKLKFIKEISVYLLIFIVINIITNELIFPKLSMIKVIFILWPFFFIIYGIGELLRGVKSYVIIIFGLIYGIVNIGKFVFDKDLIGPIFGTVAILFWIGLSIMVIFIVIYKLLSEVKH